MKVLITVITLYMWVATPDKIICQPRNHLSADWSFENCSSNDRSGNNFHASQKNGVLCVPHNNTNVLYFDGKDDYCDIGNVQLFDVDSSVTILAWVKPDNIQQRKDQFQSIITKWENRGGPQEWWFGLYGDELHFTTQNYPCATYCPEFMSQGLSLNCWSLVGIRLSRKQSSLTLVEYIKDGKVFDRDSNSYFFSPQPTSVRIGRQNPDNRPVGHYQGYIARISVYTKSLSDEELIHYYNTTFPTVVSNTTTILSCLGDTVTLYPKHNGANNIRYKWSPIENLSCSDCPSPKIIFNKKGYYNVEITSNDICLNKHIFLLDTLHQKRTVFFRTSDNQEVSPDFEPFTIAVRIVDDNDDFPLYIDHFKCKIGFKKNHMLFDTTKPLRFYQNIASTWNAKVKKSDSGDSVFIEIFSEGTTPIVNSDTVLFVPFISLLGDTEVFFPQLHCSFDSKRNSCIVAKSNSGSVRLKGCAMSMRTVTTSSLPTSIYSKYKLSEKVVYNDICLSFPSFITLEIFDVLGNIVHCENSYYSSGLHSIILDAKTLSSGQYYAILTTNIGKYFSTFLLIN